MPRNTRVCPNIITNITEVKPATAAKVMMNTAQLIPLPENAEATEAALSNSLDFTIPVKTSDTKMYKMVQITKEATMAKGTSFLGFMASPACVETASKPM